MPRKTDTPALARHYGLNRSAFEKVLDCALRKTCSSRPDGAPARALPRGGQRRQAASSSQWLGYRGQTNTIHAAPGNTRSAERTGPVAKRLAASAIRVMFSPLRASR